MKHSIPDIPVIPACPDCGGPRYRINDREQCQHCLAKKDRQDYLLKQGEYAPKIPKEYKGKQR